MNEKVNKNTKVEQLTKMFLSGGQEKGLTIKDPLCIERQVWLIILICTHTFVLAMLYA